MIRIPLIACDSIVRLSDILLLNVFKSIKKQRWRHPPGMWHRQCGKCLGPVSLVLAPADTISTARPERAGGRKLGGDNVGTNPALLGERSMAFIQLRIDLWSQFAACKVGYQHPNNLPPRVCVRQMRSRKLCLLNVHVLHVSSGPRQERKLRSWDELKDD